MNLTEWIKELIAEDRLDIFYTSRPWRKCRAISFKNNHFECAECKRNGRLTLLAKPGESAKAGEVKGIGHHIKPVRLYPELALDPKNVEPLCWICHNQIEKTKADNELTEEFW